MARALPFGVITESPPMHIVTILNPASGQEQPVLSVLNRVFRDRGVDWEVNVTQREGDAERFAAEASANGADVVAVYGGDGTVSAVASALANERTALAILPGGTGNVIAQELGIPLELEAAVRLACSGDGNGRPVDAVSFRGRLSLLRIGAGADARMICSATRDRKDRLGWIAYLAAALAQLRDPVRSTYRLTIDEHEFELEGLTCIVANVGRIGRGGLSLSRRIDPFDGLLDVLFVRDAGVESVAAVGAQLLGLGDTVPEDVEAPILHFQAREVRINCEPAVEVHCDGDSAGETPLSACVRPGAVRIVLPPPEAN